eukprot:CAMPEP_0202809902 /NCGR_PEP_ID=MMETSP1389-20130828/2108_1 /ASSEMBLY_ACC=CAM_ASM_000865 /TAXON_ID=302021 /ORGANISM="Rhodomonas sp., Strain CCMP768" /LENGTH=390 /DNA_ID=CAMNT_0049480635 /DNA_START=46 /DNA_END=1219 /DNA_ORIENTATION=+
MALAAPQTFFVPLCALELKSIATHDVSMVEIYGKAYDGFAGVYCPDGGDEMCADAFGAALGTFVSGCIICVILQGLNNRQMYKKYHTMLTGHQEPEPESTHSDLPAGWQVGFDKQSQRPFYFHLVSRKTSWTFPGENGACSPAIQTKRIEAAAPVPISGPAPPAHQPVQAAGVYYMGAPTLDWNGPAGYWPTVAPPQPVPTAQTVAIPVVGSAFGSKLDVEAADAPPDCPKVEDEQSHMLASGIVTAVAIAIHNFPEGFVCFMATYQDSSVGAAIAFAIAMHNIPEGVCVGAPVYYSTESKWKTLAAGIFGGIWAPIGGLVAWAAFGKDEDMDGRAYGCMFGLVCGIMSYLSLNELMPLAFRYSHAKWQNDLCMVLGMITMGVSILLFEV